MTAGQTLRVGRLGTDLTAARYDALISILGFESRSTHVPRLVAKNVRGMWTYYYPTNHVLSYGENADFYADHGVAPEPVANLRHSLNDRIAKLREEMPLDDRTGERVLPRIAIDISSMDRDLIAAAVLACTEDQNESLTVDFLYSCATFDRRLVGSEGPVLVNRPIHGLEGWSSDPDAGIICVVGLGFEGRLATAAIETIEPHQTVALVPVGEDPRFELVVREVNAGLIASLDAAPQEYGVNDILQTVIDLNASVSGWSRGQRVVLVPLGPKPLALASILVGVAHPENVTVWRLSADDGRQPEDRKASGTVIGLSLGTLRASSE